MQKAKFQNQNLPKGWRKVKLGELLKEKPSYGFTASASDQKIGPKFLRVTDIVNGNVNWQNVPYCKISDSEIEKYLLKKNDIVFARAGSVGFTYYLQENPPQRAVFASYLIKIKPSPNKCYPRYLAYFLKSSYYWKQVNGFLSGTTQPGINATSLQKFELFIPEDINEQRRIASILSAFDDKIELNNKINKTLEEMAQAIFKEWFIKNQKAKTKNQKLGDLVNITYGKGPASNELKKSGYPVYGANGIIGYCDSYSFSDRQIIIGCRGVVGNITLTLPKCTITHNSLVLTPLNNRKIFLYYLLKNQKLDAIAGGSAQPQITIRDLENFELAIPDEKIQDKFDSIVNIIEQKRLNNFYENQKIAELRDLLLPKLMSGEIK